MKLKATATLLALTFACTLAAKASERILPDSCGDPKMMFTATTKKSKIPPPLPAEGKAQLVLIQILVKKGFAGPFGMHDFTTRFGLDGTWLGAAANNSYFTVDITPGEHVLCGNVQNTMSGAKNMIGVKKFTAEAGKVYYFAMDATKVSTSSQNSSDNYYSSKFDVLEDEDGKFRVKSLEVSTFAPKPKE